MLFLLDANTLIDAKRDYFQFERVPEFWEWIHYHGTIGNIKIPIEIYEEFEEPRKPDWERDELSEWAARSDVKAALLLDEEADPILVRKVIAEGYCPDPTDQELESIGRDPFLISRALIAPRDRTIVTTEVSKRGKQRANRKIPDVCRDLKVRCINNIQLLRELDFKTRWKS
ncbi:MAG: DUF4411 family protein [Methylococcales bacterium]